MSEYVFKTDKPIKTCSECDYRCGLNIIARQNLNGRHENCPLVELPPHGRLGDLDLLRQTHGKIELRRNTRNGTEIFDITKAVDEIIDEAPTVLEANT